ncbi:zinc finger protein [Saccharopolyspora sp. NPDC047091]|uniref:zinc finger protein n=1 Tax=Saccharopolyspora sp. NPDC047091 TaxID=3155924 RepID=UPI0033CCF289
MLADGAKVGRWQPVSSGRHAFGLDARSSEPGGLTRALCGVVVRTDELQRVADEIDWIREPTCMDCWRELAARAR